MGFCDIDIASTGDQPVDESVCSAAIHTVYPFLYWNFDDQIGPVGNSWGYINIYTEQFTDTPSRYNVAFSSRGEVLDL